MQDLNEWGSDFKKETDLEMLLLLNTNLGSVAFNRDYGIPDNENVPMSTEFSSLFALQILGNIEEYNETARKERQIVSDFERIVEIDFDPNGNTIENEIGYFRLIDYLKED
jgi:hypothetical protein